MQKGRTMRIELKVPYEYGKPDRTYRKYEDLYETLSVVITEVPKVKSIDVENNYVVLDFDTFDEGSKAFTIMQGKQFKDLVFTARS